MLEYKLECILVNFSKLFFVKILLIHDLIITCLFSYVFLSSTAISCQLRARQKGANAVQRCSVENQKGLSLYKVYGNSTLLVLNKTSFKHH